MDSVAELIHKYGIDNPNHPLTFARGDLADADPAVPNGRIAVDEDFGPFAME